MARRLRRRLAAALTGAALAAGILTAGAVVTAPAAAAESYTDCFRIFGTADGECYVTYTWWEQFWYGDQNHWEYEPGIYNWAYAG